MPSCHINSNPVELFLKSWQVYQEIIARNYMFHQEISAAVHSKLHSFKRDKELHVLDLGCGDASMTLPILGSERIASYVGCDLSRPALHIADKQLDLQKIKHKLICADMLQVVKAQTSSSIDVVFSSYAIHHLSKIEKEHLISEIARVLSSGGCFVLIDIFLEPTEDRQRYMVNYMSTIQEKWTELSQDARDLVINHATAFDFPEHPSLFDIRCTEVGFSSGQQLAKHTWHEAWIFSLKNGYCHSI